MQGWLKSIARVVLGRLNAGGAARTIASGMSWRAWAIAGAAALVLILAAFFAGAWWQGDRSATSARAAAADAVAAADRRAAAAQSQAAAARRRAGELEIAAAEGSAIADAEREAAAAAIGEEVRRVLSIGGDCPIGDEFGRLWNGAVARAPAD